MHQLHTRQHVSCREFETNPPASRNSIAAAGVLCFQFELFATTLNRILTGRFLDIGPFIAKAGHPSLNPQIELISPSAHS